MLRNIAVAHMFDCGRHIWRRSVGNVAIGRAPPDLLAHVQSCFESHRDCRPQTQAADLLMPDARAMASSSSPAPNGLERDEPRIERCAPQHQVLDGCEM